MQRVTRKSSMFSFNILTFLSWTHLGPVSSSVSLEQIPLSRSNLTSRTRVFNFKRRRRRWDFQELLSQAVGVDN